MICTRGLTRHFGKTVAVSNLTLEIGAGEVFGFLGHNGAGKTTTVRLLNGILAPTAGEARLLGLDPVMQGATLRRQTGVLTETPSLDDRLTARTSLRLFAKIYGLPTHQIDHRIDTLLQTFQLQAYADQKIGGYSKGTRQRLALARTLLHEPKLIFLDEPTSGLDPIAIRDVHQLIQELTQAHQRTVFLCTHNLVEAQRLCHRVAVLAHGQVLAIGTPRELATQFNQSARVKLRIGIGQEELLPQLLAPYPQIQIRATNDRDQETTQIALQGVAQTHLPDLLRHLTTQGLQLFAVEPEEASLEDVYFALQELRPAAARLRLSQA
ncbi:MAG: ABC transporter ATP-binding protein [Caldilineaceae bacterium]|nr:ABC transporter ATP-binding protein [Caldilineaceae bacterium]